MSADQEVMKSILLNCRGRTIRVADVRAASISKERCWQQHFRTVMSTAEENGVGKLLNSGGGRGHGQPVYVFSKDPYNDNMAESCRRYGIDPMVFV